MSFEVDAIYENGALKLDHPLPLNDHERVKIVVQPANSVARRCWGIMGWTGDPATVRQAALDPHSGLLESPWSCPTSLAAQRSLSDFCQTTR